ncbi:hypothetical protein TRIUR3_01244 [Triticum urartu]|uniref:Uncharacterized protein n=1 Tax=Triticum urartu TaxID=4572 RepID=M8AEW5_TRIUA|nr:hypothetical protein TRIUR3_01244 [Triticum urartu]
MRRSSQQNLLLPCILLLLLLVSMSCLPSSSHGLRTLREEEEAVGELIKGQHELPPTISPTQQAGGDDVAAADDIGAGKFTVSRRAGPQGPNPLHN